MRVSLRTKISGLVLSLLLLVIALLTGAFAYIEKEDVEDQMGQLALRVASTVSFMPSVQQAFQQEDPSRTIQPIALRVQEETGAEFVVVGNAAGIRYAHPDPDKIGKKMVGGDNDRAVMDGEYYVSTAEGSLGPSMRGKAPIYSNDGDIVGLVSVGFLLEDVRSSVWKKMSHVFGIALLTLLIGVIGSLFLARSIKKDTLGLEPYQITSFYQARQAILSSVKEGIISINEQGNVTMINNSAMELLNIKDKTEGRPIKEVFPNTKMLDVLRTGRMVKDEEMRLQNKIVIVNRTPIIQDDKVIGVVSSFRDKTEVREMVQALSEVKRYSEGLRSQTHEHANKMYLLLGLLQLGKQNEAVAMIEEEYTYAEKNQRIIFDRIGDDTVQAILAGKMSKASELKVEFVIQEESELQRVPSHISRTDLVTVLGNIIDNAFEAVQNQEEKRVEFFATDVGEAVVFEVTDSGGGIPEDSFCYLFIRGYSTKQGEMRGYGLSNVKEVIDKQKGSMEISDAPDGGTVFSIFFPKVKGADEYESDGQ
ncbi:sensor histidine kinase [Halobacillus sp. ACCC02827]|uniref:ATP-binding protein n=1 Tax=Bacillaceae TaxID=186817 RepID=UPI000423A41F|nr:MULTISPECIES: sensor histidine kinase [Bacillaceae]QHT47777.1 sensor histidine kinase [Bacillus sp. SB49]WJE15019.1 sensor histidine kinase [Halobacillus sp. ACCC02827]